MLPGSKSRSFGAFSQDSLKRLPTRVHCPQCGEIMLLIVLKPDELAGAIASGALAAKKVSCTCGVEGVIALRQTAAGLFLYSITFWIMPGTAEKIPTDTKGLLDWLKKPPPVSHA